MRQPGEHQRFGVPHASVITHGSVAARAARELIVLTTALKEPDCSPAATVQPSTSSTGATADETIPGHGTPGTTTTVSQRAEGSAEGCWPHRTRFADRSGH